MKWLLIHTEQNLVPDNKANLISFCIKLLFVKLQYFDFGV